MDNEVCQLNWEGALYDVTHILCKHLDGIGLLNFSQVCKSWRVAALNERSKRSCIQQLPLSFKMGSELQVIPSVSLLIYDVWRRNHDKSKWFRRSDGFHKELLEDLNKQLPNKIILFAVDKHHSTEDPQFQDCKEQCDVKPAHSSELLGLFFSNQNHRFRVHVCSFSIWDVNQIYFDELLNRAANELGLNDGGYSKSAILVISEIMPIIYKRMVLDELYKRFQQKGEHTIMYLFCLKHETNSGDSVMNDQDDEIPRDYCDGLIILRISGPSVETWATYIDYRAGHDEVERKLDELQKQVKPKRHYFGLLYSTSCESAGCKHIEHPIGDSHGMMCRLKRIFPFIRFSGMFIGYSNALYTEDDIYDLDLQTSIVIISHD